MAPLFYVYLLCIYISTLNLGPLSSLSIMRQSAFINDLAGIGQPPVGVNTRCCGCTCLASAAAVGT